MYLKSLASVRERCSLLLEYPQYLTAFDVHLDQLGSVTNMLLLLILRDYPTPNDIPPHTRSRHFEISGIPGIPKVDRLGALQATWKSQGINDVEITKRLIDLTVVSVLVDAGAGNAWKYTSDAVYTRSEGLALASLDLFTAGGFSGDHSHSVDSIGLESLTLETFNTAFQVGPGNPLAGGPGRFNLLKRLGTVLMDHPEFFKLGHETCRPGHLLDYLTSHSSGDHVVALETLWTVVMDGFSHVWPPSPTTLDDVHLGDVWHCKALAGITSSILCPESKKNLGLGNDLVPFHKLSQWLTYSLVEPLQAFGITFTGLESLTGLPEYRNGGLFIDLGVLTFKPSYLQRHPEHALGKHYLVSDDLIVEWRALTVGLLDLVAGQVRSKLGMTEAQLPLAKVLEAGTWKAGREMAAKLRPSTKGPPIEIKSDGTVF